MIPYALQKERKRKRFTFQVISYRVLLNLRKPILYSTLSVVGSFTYKNMWSYHTCQRFSHRGKYCRESGCLNLLVSSRPITVEATFSLQTWKFYRMVCVLRSVLFPRLKKNVPTALTVQLQTKSTCQQKLKFRPNFCSSDWL
jgi:hypothetical protein